MTPTRLYDTCVFVHHYLESSVEASRLISEAISRKPMAGFSIITEAELWVGVRNYKEEKRRRMTLRNLRRLALTVPIARQAGEIRRNNLSIKLPDAIIAATAIYHSIPLYTNNTDDFKNIPGLNLIPYKQDTQA